MTDFARPDPDRGLVGTGARRGDGEHDCELCHRRLTRADRVARLPDGPPPARWVHVTCLAGRPAHE